MEDGRSQINVGITPDRAVEFLQKLAADDEFRARFESDTRALLAEYDIEVPADMIPEPVHAPPRGLLWQALAEMGKEPTVLVPFATAMPKVPFMPVPFAPFSYAFSLVFIALQRAQNA
jgi:hypothetical protein